MDVRTIERADEALELLGGALRQAGAEGEMSYGVLARLVDDPHAWGAEVTILAGMDGDDPRREYGGPSITPRAAYVSEKE